MDTDRIKVNARSDVDLLTEFGLVASEISTGDLTTEVEILGDYDVDQIGSYTIVFKVSDRQANTTQKAVTVDVMDNIPHIAASRAARIIEEAVIDDSFLLQKANIVAENSDGSYASKSQIEIVYPEEFDASKPRPQPYQFTAIIHNKQSINNETNQVVFNIFVDGVRPSLYYDHNKLFYDINEPLPSLNQLKLKYGLTAKEFEFGDTNIELSVTNNSGSIEKQAGVYPIQVIATDDDGQQTIEHLQLIITDDQVQDDIIAPEISLVSTVAVPEGEALTDSELYSLFNPIVTDDEKNIKAIMKHSDINWQITGQHQVTFTATDSDGNTVAKSGKLILTDVLPEITFKTNPVIIAEGDEITDYVSSFGIVGTELTAGDLTSKVEIIKPTIDRPGSYNITFRVWDDEGNPDIETLRLIVKE